MTITIQQTLHGYLNGHQLLNSSVELTNEEKRTLLYQSDLSGSNVDEEFKNYITGYPIKKRNLYAFAKTWYANEMRRPGCVWTHTLLINFSDLGKIPEFKLLLEFFKRPEVDKYESYGEEIKIEERKLISNFYVNYQNIEDKKYDILPALYEDPTEAIIVPSSSSAVYEDVILSIWSDQWPRLRRNFSFCSGSLSVKSIESKIFDLQIVPYSKLNLLQRQTINLLVVKGRSVESNFNWEVVDQYPKLKLRQFLWAYGSDINGERENYLPLLKIFATLNSSDVSIQEISNTISESFPHRDQAQHLKSSLYGNESILVSQLGEREIINYLVTSEDLDFISNDAINIDGRLEEMIFNKEISFEEFIYIWKNAKPGRINKNVWKSFKMDATEVINLIEEDEQLLDIFLENNSDFLTQQLTWKISYQLQKEILRRVKYDDLTKKQNDIITAALEAESPIILDMFGLIGEDSVIISLNWLNNPRNKKSLISEWSASIARKNKSVFISWLIKNKKSLNNQIFAVVFIYFHYDDIKNLNFESEIWIRGYRLLQENNYNARLEYVASILLSLALGNKLASSEEIIVETFHDVYSYAASSRIEYALWKLIPKEDSEFEDDEDYTPASFLARLFGLNVSKKRYQVEDWDYCEQLIRTLTTKYLKYSWPTQSFLNALKNKSAFERVVEYCLGFKRGRKFLERIYYDILNGRTEPLSFQRHRIEIIGKELIQ